MLHVLKTGKAICNGYSLLYKAMCNAAHVECVMVTGWGRVDKSMPGYSESPDSADHAWNAIRVNGNWHNVDACWGHPDNGYDIGLYYFCTPPEQLIYDHYPENGKWALLPVVPSLNGFFASPRLYPAYFSSGVKVLYPRIGTIQGPPGMVVSFRLVGINQPVYLEIVQVPNDSVLAYHEDEQSPVMHNPQELERTKPYHYNPKISKKEKQAVDAIMDYVNSIPASDSNVYKSSPTYHDTAAIAASDISEKLPGDPLVVNGNTVSFKYLLPRDGVKEIDIFVNGKAIATYDVVIQQGQ